MRMSNEEIQSESQRLLESFEPSEYVAQATAAIAQVSIRNPEYWKGFKGYFPEVARMMQEHGHDVPEGMEVKPDELVLYRHETDFRTMVAAMLTINEVTSYPVGHFPIETPEGVKLYQHGVGVIGTQ